MGRVPKNRRQHLLARLLADNAVTSQSQLVELLLVEGIDATQATISRDLEELGALKVRMPGIAHPVYGIAEPLQAPQTPIEHLRRVLGEWVVEMASSGNLVVVRTPPGSAHVVASALDRSRLDGMVGTVAGDDTVLVIADEATGGAGLAAVLGQLAGRQ
ncbi:MAG: ArgR family transcriptional regulator [Acidimicrobiales bacterium]|jgi:transcriptional regulator of arginine metabolism